MFNGIISRSRARSASRRAQRLPSADHAVLRSADRILRLLLDYEAAQRRHELLKKQLETREQQQRVARVSYRRGRGSTSQMLGMSDKRDLVHDPRSGSAC